MWRELEMVEDSIEDDVLEVEAVGEDNRTEMVVLMNYLKIVRWLQISRGAWGEEQDEVFRVWDGTHAGEVGEQRDDGEFEEGSHAGSFDMIFL